MPEHPVRASLLAFGLFLSGVVLGSITGQAIVVRAQAPYADVDLVQRVLRTIEQNHVDPVSSEELAEAAIRGMVDALDPHTRWLQPHEVRILLDEPRDALHGVGVEVRATDDALEILDVQRDSAAGRADLRPGDRILAIDGLTVARLGPVEALQALEGPAGSRVLLVLLREGWPEPREIPLDREPVRASVVSVERLGDVVYARLSRFRDGAADELAAALQAALDEGPARGLVLDLRDNPGGLLDEAVAVADLFLDEGIIVTTRRRSPGEQDEMHRASPGGLPGALPMVALINRGSASASEIVAAALQETGRAPLVGERTFGKGTVQQIYRTVDGAGPVLKLTVGRYLTPSGEPVTSGDGRAPDHEVPWPTAARRAVPWDAPVRERLPLDPQLARALELLGETALVADGAD